MNKHIIFGISCTLALLACNEAQIVEKPSPQVVKAEPRATVVETGESLDSRLDKLEKDFQTQDLVAATLAFDVATSGTLETICSGKVKGKIRIADLAGADQQLDITKLIQIEQGTVSCLSLTIDINTVLGLISSVPTGSSSAPPPSINDLEVRDGAIALKKFGEASFAPSRPVFPNLLAERPEVLSAINIMQSTTLTSAGVSYTGNFGLKMDQFAQPYKTKDGRITWPDTMSFSLSSSGFTDAPVVPNLLFEKISFTMSRKPLMLAAIQVKTSLYDMVVGSLDAATKNSFLGSLATRIVDSEFVKGLVSDVRLTVEVVEFADGGVAKP